MVSLSSKRDNFYLAARKDSKTPRNSPKINFKAIPFECFSANKDDIKSPTNMRFKEVLGGGENYAARALEKKVLSTLTSRFLLDLILNKKKVLSTYFKLVKEAYAGSGRQGHAN